MAGTQGDDRVYVPHWIVQLLIKLGIPFSIMISAAAFGFVVDMWRNVNELNTSFEGFNNRLVELESFADQGPRVTAADLDRRADKIAEVYAKTIENQSSTLNQVLEIQRSNTILLNRMDERLLNHDRRLNKLEGP